MKGERFKLQKAEFDLEVCQIKHSL